MAQSLLPSIRTWVCGLGLLGLVSSVGCQSDYAGQTLPSPYWLKDDVQYFPPGAEFKLSNEAAAMKAYGGARRGPAPRGPIGPPIPANLDGNAPTPGLDVGVPPNAVPGAAAPGAAVPDAGAAAPGDAPAAMPADAGAPDAGPDNPFNNP